MSGLAPYIRHSFFGILLLCLIHSSAIAVEIQFHIPTALNNTPLVNHLTKAFKSPSNIDSNVIVTLGPEELRNVLVQKNKPEFPVIALLITREEFYALTDNHSDISISALFMEPSPKALTEFAVQLLGDEANLLLPVHRDSSFARFIQMQQFPSTIQVIETDSAKQWLRQLRNVQGVIAQPDSGLFTTANITAIARSLFRQQKVLIGYSKEMTQKRGALASLYTSDNQLIQDAIALIQELHKHPQTPIQTYPTQYRVILNTTLAKTLGFHHLDERQLETQLNAALAMDKQGAAE
ncbi:hypothetical protein [Teredinibacter sp. KSP-S5-2]|uniref:hypothetical protein n=1 Tax=Teredinibacter sp. KSP-S5-2 TaxID=3034506 RepID=UPI002934E7BD|nr:hypothetical protein [Teredinibacter sp. KSP-S5-2]WNO10464.1 hypothetical protein P5V12_04695 [Teredinibacter sp. KSP-S5-2]